MEHIQSCSIGKLADCICEIRGDRPDKCQGCIFDDYGLGDCKQNRLQWLRRKDVLINEW